MTNTLAALAASAAHRPAIAAVVQQHCEDAAILWHTRRVQYAAAHNRLDHLRRIDERLAAHLAAIVLSGPAGWRIASASLDAPGSGDVFVLAVTALAQRHAAQWDGLVALVQAVPETGPALVSALGWMEPAELQGLGLSLLRSPRPIDRYLGLAACGVHRADPGELLTDALAAPEPAVRERALRTAGELGRTDLLPRCLAGLHGEVSVACRFRAAWSAVLLGDRAIALDALLDMANHPAPYASEALRLGVLASAPARRAALMQEIAQRRDDVRRLVQLVAWSGDAAHVPWLIGLMGHDALARVAGEAFSFITGADLALLDLERKPPQGVQDGPNDDPGDDAVEVAADEGLPWPDAQRVQSWWEQHQPRFAIGASLIAGAALGADPCAAVLTRGPQRQRQAAALHLSLMRPGTPLFNCQAPALRQQRLLGVAG